MAEKDRFTQRSQRGNQRAIPLRDDVVSEMQAPTTEPSIPNQRITVAEFIRMDEQGLFEPDERIELLDGELIAMPRQAPEHSYCAGTVSDFFYRCFADRACVSTEGSLKLDDFSLPQPDVMINLGPRTRYARTHPTPDDALLVVEVSKSTLAFDRGRKLRVYARRRVREYWIVNLVHDRVDVYRVPRGDRYAKHLIARRGETLAPEAFPDGTIEVDQILPPV
jgi:Uma2 family endonuclease